MEVNYIMEEKMLNEEEFNVVMRGVIPQINQFKKQYSSNAVCSKAVEAFNKLTYEDYKGSPEKWQEKFAADMGKLVDTNIGSGGTRDAMDFLGDVTRDVVDMRKDIDAKTQQQQDDPKSNSMYREAGSKDGLSTKFRELVARGVQKMKGSMVCNVN
jgi:hypothetical protein